MSSVMFSVQSLSSHTQYGKCETQIQLFLYLTIRIALKVSNHNILFVKP